MCHDVIYCMFACVDCVCEMEADTKSYPNCFTVGPIIDDGATRTYFISCCKFTSCVYMYGIKGVCINVRVCVCVHACAYMCVYMYVCASMCVLTRKLKYKILMHACERMFYNGTFQLHLSFLIVYFSKLLKMKCVNGWRPLMLQYKECPTKLNNE